MKPPLIVIAGPTACGKTALAIQLAKRVNGEIISADSMQIYKYMDIGTAKPSVEEMGGVSHYLIDELYPDEPFSVAIFKQMAKRYIKQIYDKGKIPIIAGGTGFYIQAVTKDVEFEPSENDYEYRNELLETAKIKGNSFVHDMLVKADPEAAAAIHENNIKRVVRALEYVKLTGEKISAHNEREKKKESVYRLTEVILHCGRDKLYGRIEARIDEMIREGLAEEVKSLLDRGYGKELTSMQGLGYKEIIPYIEGSVPLETAVEQLKQNTRRFAKRQLTWFKNKSAGLWINIDETSQMSIIDSVKKNIEYEGWLYE